MSTKPGKTERLAFELASEAHSRASKFLDASVDASQTDCKNGCSHCCHQPATVFPFEAIQIAKTLKNSLSEAQLDALKEKMISRVRDFAGASVRKNINNKTACPLLSNDRCSVYEQRPLTCRMAHSFSVKKCRAALQKDRNQVQIPVSLEILDGVGEIIQDFYKQLPKRKVDGKMYELCSAVLAALNQPDAAARWANGDLRVFEKCIQDDT